MMIYQYRREINQQSLEYLFDLLANGRINFQNPNKFNDPFDCCPQHIPVDLVKESGLPAAVINSMNSSMHGVISAVCGICCFSSAPDNMLLWSHYGDHHRSVCVGFDADFLASNVPVNNKGNPLYEGVTKVIYGNNRPSSGSADAYHVKAECWEYEDEYRLISGNSQGEPEWGPGVWSLPTGSIKQVIFGARMDQELKDFIAERVKRIRPDIELLVVVPNPNTFDLLIESYHDQPSIPGRSRGVIHGPNGNWIETG